VGANYCMAEDITWPDMPVKPKKTVEKDISIAFVSDLHIGSKFFFDKQFERMLKWLSGMGPYKDAAERIGYMFIAGDVADGIGNYPKQEKDLAVKDIFEQYQIVEKILELVPDHIKIILIPGNHDAVRLAEPQPAIGKDLLGNLPNVVSIGNPGFVNVEGFESILYHGVSLGSIIANVPGLTPAKPEEAVVELLKRRNLAPIYDENDIAPEHLDYHYIDNCDIINTGHMHKNGYTEYRGCVVVASGTWQDLTEYQVKQGHVATPCILSVYNLKDGRVAQFDFSGDEIKML
ncbi:MAG: metallophosphoesterase, partial [Candidatus Micrarchaeia archaeon]